MEKMKFLDLSTDVLAIKCVKNHVFIGIGCTLYIINKNDSKVENKIDALHPDNIHNITINDNKLIVYGRKSFRLFHLTITDSNIRVQKSDEIHRFEDWIINIKWLEPSNDSILTILFAHNNVYNYDLQKKQHSNTPCKETCLLYAGNISGCNRENAIVLSGTVFQEILLWKVKPKTNNKYSEVLHRLKGHKGVIFSVFYHPLNNLICSTSDDRTVRLWKVLSKPMIDEESLDWESVDISLQTTMYGHLARVWKAVLLKNTIASIGEDSRICFWSLTGDLLHKIEAHQGAPIWCIDMSEDDIVYTGGADGSVNSWSLASIKSQIQDYVLLEDDKDMIPKHVAFLANSDILIYSNFRKSSMILYFRGNSYQLFESYNLPEYSSNYCIMELSTNRDLIALASIKGDVTLYNKTESAWEQVGTYKIVNSKIFSMQWLNDDTALICAADGILYIITFLSNSAEILSEHVLPPSRERWTTSACVHKNLLICGDRMGSVFIYKLKSSLKDPLQSFKKIHGRLGVQSCTIMNSNLLTTGRDGTLRFYKFCDINSENPTIEFLYSKNMPMDWVSQLLKTENDYYVLGFKEDDFVIYSIFLKRMLVKIPCGGGHRSWDCIIHDKKIKFMYIQKRKVHVITVPLDTLFIPPLLMGFHTKEIYCVEMLPTSFSDYNILVSGGEDCTLHISYIKALTSESELNLKTVNWFDGHLSNIKCLSIFTLTLDENIRKYLIFSGGGRAQLKVWEVTIKTKESSFSSENISCKDLLSYMLHGPDKERNKIWVGKELMYNADPETRYMDLSTIKNPQSLNSIFVFIACSDGYLRTLNYNLTLNEIKLIDTLAYNNRCILKVHSFVHQERILLMTMATDGLLTFWNVTVLGELVTIQNVLIDEKEGLSLHQSGINSFDIKVLDDYNYLLATGGDDNLLNLLAFEIILKENSISIQVISLWKTVSIHYAQITGVKLLHNNRLISIGADQKLAIHEYSFDNLNICSRLLQENTLCISDIQGITFCENQKNCAKLFCIYGKGFQLVQI